MNLTATKSIKVLREEADAQGEGSLKRTLTALNLTTLGIGAIVGAGIFVITGNAAAKYAGPAVAISFVLAGIACGFAGLCYAEMAAAVPVAGSAYTYAYATLGELVAWIIGWDLVLEYAMGASTVSVGWSGYFVSLLRGFGVHLPPALTTATSRLCEAVDVAGGCPHTGLVFSASVNVPAIFIALFATAVLVVGIRESANVNNVIVVVKLAILALFIFFGVRCIDMANYNEFVPPQFGWGGIARAGGQIFFAYIGFDAVSTAAQEAKNPQRDMPRGILASLAICTVLYIVVSLVLTGIVNYRELNVAHPVGYAVEHVARLKWMTPIVDLGAVAGLASVIIVMLLGQSRVFYSMSRDGLLPPWVGKIHPKTRTPVLTQIVVGVFAAVFGGMFPIAILGELVSIGTLLAFVIVCAGILVLRRTRPDLDRPFKTPFVPWVPLGGIVFCLYLMYSLPRDTWIRLFVWMAIGFVVYFTYGRKHSKLAMEK
jgi:APA family basic amino acid/polyamine antiporter